MGSRNIIWLPSFRNKLFKFRSDRYTPEETFDFISQILLEAEYLLSNNIIGRTYMEELGSYKGMSRIVTRKFKIYFKLYNEDIVILGILFPGEN